MPLAITETEMWHEVRVAEMCRAVGLTEAEAKRAWPHLIQLSRIAAGEVVEEESLEEGE